MVTCILTKSPVGNKIIRDFARNIKSTLVYAKRLVDAPLTDDEYVNWGVLRGSEILIKRFLAEKKDFYYLDHAYFGAGHRQPTRRYRITKNAFQAREIIDRPSDRWNDIKTEIKPWKKSGSYILVCPPTPPICHCFGVESWLDDTLKILHENTDREIIVRIKPAEIQIDLTKRLAEPIYPDKIKSGEISLDASLDEQMAEAWAVVVYNSAVAINAVCAGIPVFVDHQNAAYTVGITDFSKIEEPVYPEREPWLYHLAYNQFTIYEIRSGYAYEAVR